MVRLRWEDHVSPGVPGQPGQHETVSEKEMGEKGLKQPLVTGLTPGLCVTIALKSQMMKWRPSEVR